MATPAQIRANRANALRSTGPRSETGRQITKFNALKHGLAAKELIIPGEDPAAFDAIIADLVAEHQPSCPTEALLVEELAICWWRLHRARREEAGIITGVRRARQLYDSPVIVGLLRYTVAAERAWNRALANLRTAQNDRRKRPDDPAEAAPPPQPQEKEKVMAIGSVLQKEPEAREPEAGPAPEAPSELTTDHAVCASVPDRSLTTAIGSVPQDDPVTEHGSVPEAPSRLTTDQWPPTTDVAAERREKRAAILENLRDTGFFDWLAANKANGGRW